MLKAKVFCPKGNATRLVSLVASLALPPSMSAQRLSDAAALRAVLLPNLPFLADIPFSRVASCFRPPFC